MFQEYFARSPLLAWPLVGLVLFLFAFVGVLVYVGVGLRDRRRVDRLAALPLEGDEAGDDAGNDEGDEFIDRNDRDERMEG